MLHASIVDRVRVAVLIPCYNEAATIAEVVRGFRAVLPRALIYVYDNNSTDNTVVEAKNAGAQVFFEGRQGKGNVVRRMFADVNADIYIMADGDGTYDPADAPELIRTLMIHRADMAVGTRRGINQDAGRLGHAFGNTMFNRLYHVLFGRDFSDIMSGYRAFTNRFVKSFPAVSTGFEIETELSVHASRLMIPTVEIPLYYGRRPECSPSKLRTFRDGIRILFMFLTLLKETRPALLFGITSVVFLIAAIILAVPLFEVYLSTGLVPRFPTAILVTGLAVVAVVLVGVGLVLDSLARSRVEQKRILYLLAGRLITD